MPPLDVAAIRSRLAEAGGPDFWRSLEELAESAEFRQYLDHEFPELARAFPVDRRQFLQLAAALLGGMGLSACEGPPQKWIVPYQRSPEWMVPGQPLFFASCVLLDGYAMPVLVESNMGRPTKVEGNPGHPASLGSTDIYAQAGVLDLWDPERSKAVSHRGNPSSWDEFHAALMARLSALPQGEGLYLLTETFTSPALNAQMQALLARYPKARWHRYHPLATGNAYEGTRLAFGKPLECRYHFDQAAVILSLDADFLREGPAHLRHARDFAARRDPNAAMNRLYVLESAPGLAGAVADHRFAARACDIEAWALRIARALGVAGISAASSEAPTWLGALARDLQNAEGASVVIAGERQPPIVHALAHAINFKLKNVGTTVEYTEPASLALGDADLRGLAAELAAGKVDTLLMLGGNPAYNSPVDLDFSGQLAKAGFSCQLSLYEDETSAAAEWHVPLAHELESWGDARAFDGSVTIQQPLIAPLYGGRSGLEFLAACLGEPQRDGYDIVREYWRTHFTGGDFESLWQSALRKGWIEGSAFPTLAVEPVAGLSFVPPSVDHSGLEVQFIADPTVHDGRFANNGWLQELPKPLLGLAWDNAALIGPALAERLGLANEAMAELDYRGRRIEAPVWIMPGLADRTVILPLGYGRGGRVASGCGFNAYALRQFDRPWFDDGLQIRGTGRSHALAAVQHHHAMLGRPIVQTATLAEFRANPNFANATLEPAASLYPPYPREGYAWGMSIDLNRCIGCNACTIACQAENNIPVVGKAEVMRGREMHWIRVDRYYRGSLDNPQTLFQPVPCMHCEQAPCEYVCPVEASIHDAEGLNVQVYNRCIGTRFCSNNCPYKVRRFNFLDYVDERPGIKAQKNPDVTVRWRGVMEKCTYCLQRISTARIAAEKENRRLRDGEVVTACQAVCPTEAIVFGDINDPASRVSRAKASPLNYSLLGELGTRPRTTYLARVANPNPEIDAGAGDAVSKS